MYYDTNCTIVSIDVWNRLMKDAKPCNYKWLVARIKKHIPYLYKDLCLDFPNPYAQQCSKTKTHYILVHSAIEYFIHK